MPPLIDRAARRLRRHQLQQVLHLAGRVSSDIIRELGFSVTGASK